MKNKVPTVFTNSEIGISMQKMWLAENQSILSSKSFEAQSDFVLVIPEGNNAITMWVKLKDKWLPEGEMNDAITKYVTEKRMPGKVVVIFLNLEGRISYYTIYSNFKP